MRWTNTNLIEHDISVIKYTDVFVPGGFPHHTYNPRETLDLEARLNEITENLCKLVTVTGHTKSGKTVLVRKVLPTDKAIWVDGGAVGEADEFWEIILDKLEGHQEITSDTSKGTESEISAKGSAGANFIVAKGESEIGAARKFSRGESTATTLSTSARVAALRALAISDAALVIDDFHYLPKALQGGVVRALKPLIFDGLPVVVIAIPHRRFDAVKVEKEMTGRILPISIPTWSIDELSYIPNTGFPLLELELSESMSSSLADEAIGSPHLMQEFCRAVARSSQSDNSSITLTEEEMESIFSTVAETIGRPIFEKLARGPRQRTDRLPRELTNGQSVDIYELVLYGLAQLKPGLSTYEYEDLRAGIREVSAGQIPQLQEVARVLKHMATIASTDQSSTPVIDFEENDKRLHVTDPFFAFFLRRGNLNRS